MPHLSKKKLDKQTHRLLESASISLFSHASSSETKKLFETLLTKTERLMIAKRIGAGFLLKENAPETKISETLKLSRETVSRFDLLMRAQPPENWELIFKKLKKWQEFNALTNVLKEAGIYLLKTFSRGMAGKI